MSTQQNEYLHNIYADTLRASRFNTFKILNALIIALFVLLFLNVLFTPPDNTLSYLLLILAVVSVLFMFYRLTREKAGMKNMPEDISNMDGDIIRESINKIRDNQRKLRWQMGLFTIPFLFSTSATPSIAMPSGLTSFPNIEITVDNLVSLSVYIAVL